MTALLRLFHLPCTWAAFDYCNQLRETAEQKPGFEQCDPLEIEFCERSRHSTENIRAKSSLLLEILLCRLYKRLRPDLSGASPQPQSAGRRVTSGQVDR